MPTDEKRAYTKSHWQKYIPSKKTTSIFVPPNPTRLGEHDVDTIIHLLFRHFGFPDAFEGMCNPPGGDWSGISLQTNDRKKILRWLSLPRVSGEHSKRPDHVFEIFNGNEKPILLTIESKDTAARIESNIGNRLNEYMADLLISEPSAEYVIQDQKWSNSIYRLDQNQFQMASAVAFMMQTDDDIHTLHNRANADLVCGFSYNSGTNVCTINCHPYTEIGQKLIDFMIKYQKNGFGIDVKKI
jgi:hypothetical protein